MKKTLAAIAAIALAVLGVVAVPTVAFAAGSVTVTVEDQAHAPVLGAQVSALTSNGGVTLSPVIGVPGAYMNASLSPGTYSIIVVAPGFARQYYSGSVNRTGATPVVVTEGGSQTLAMTVAPESKISGTITDHNGLPYHAVVGLYSDNEGGLAIGAIYSDTVTGYYEFPSLPAGDYRILVNTNPNSTESTQWYVQANSAATATVIHLGASDSQTIDMQLAYAGTLAGTATNAVGSPVRIEIAATPSDRSVTSSAGSYSLGGLLPDTYSFTTRDSANFYEVMGTDAMAITAGSTVTHDFVASPRLLDDAEMLATSTQVAPLSGPATVEAGGTYTWTVTPPDDDDLYVVLYSTPVLLGVVANSSNTTATITVTIPTTTPAGTHQLAVWAYDDSSGFGGPSRSYFPIQVTAATLPDTGSDAAIPFGVALTLLLGGALVLTAARRRTATTRVG